MLLLFLFQAILVAGQVLMPESLLGDGQFGLHGREGQRVAEAIGARMQSTSCLCRSALGFSRNVSS